MVVFTKQ